MNMHVPDGEPIQMPEIPNLITGPNRVEVFDPAFDRKREALNVAARYTQGGGFTADQVVSYAETFDKFLAGE